MLKNINLFKFHNVQNYTNYCLTVHNTVLSSMSSMSSMRYLTRLLGWLKAFTHLSLTSKRYFSFNYNNNNVQVMVCVSNTKCIIHILYKIKPIYMSIYVTVSTQMTSSPKWWRKNMSDPIFVWQKGFCWFLVFDSEL